MKRRSSAERPARLSVDRDCLVGVVSSDADLNHFLTNGWYRLPDRILGRLLHASTLEDLRTVALYQSGQITEGLPGAIEHYGSITSIESLQRRELLPDESNHPHADDLYHRLLVENITTLPCPLLSRQPRRVSFIRTTTDRLLQAEDIGDLILGTRSEEVIADRLRQIVSEVDRTFLAHVGGRLVELDFGFMVNGTQVGLQCTGENKKVENVKGGRRGGEIREDDQVSKGSEKDTGVQIIRFSPVQIENEPEEIIRKVLALIERLGSSGR